MCVWTTFLSFFCVAVRIGHFFFRFSVCVGLILFVFCLLANFEITNSKLNFCLQRINLKRFLCKLYMFNLKFLCLCDYGNYDVFSYLFQLNTVQLVLASDGTASFREDCTALAEKQDKKKTGFRIRIRFYGTGSSLNSE